MPTGTGKSIDLVDIASVGTGIRLWFVASAKSLVVDMPLCLACSVCHSSLWRGDLYREEDHLLQLMFISSIMYRSFVAIRRRSFLSGIASIDFSGHTAWLGAALLYLATVGQTLEISSKKCRMFTEEMLQASVGLGHLIFL